MVSEVNETDKASMFRAVFMYRLLDMTAHIGRYVSSIPVPLQLRSNELKTSCTPFATKMANVGKVLRVFLSCMSESNKALPSPSTAPHPVDVRVQILKSILGSTKSHKVANIHANFDLAAMYLNFLSRDNPSAKALCDAPNKSIDFINEM